jgi:hypothetical protein
MEYPKHIEIFKEELVNQKDTTGKKIKLVENVNYHKTHVENLGEFKLPDPEFGDLKLSVMPFENNGEWVNLPDGFKLWKQSFNDILKMIPLQEGANQHYVTIDTKFFTNDEFLRREGVHMDGNFCVDPNFRTLNEANVEGVLSDEFFDDIEDEFKASWGGAETKPSWGGSSPREREQEDKSSWGGIKPSWGGSKVAEYQYEAKEDNSHVKMDWVLPYKLTIPIADLCI